MRGKLLFALVLSVMFITSSANAFALYEGDEHLLGSQYIAPRFDCDGLGQKCVLLAYNVNTNAVDIFITNTRFTDESYPLTKNRTLVTDSEIATIIYKNNASSIPYDVAYVSTSYDWEFTDLNTDFAITYGNKIYGIDTTEDSFGHINTTTQNEFSGDVWWFIDHTDDVPEFISINLTNGSTDFYHKDGFEKDISGFKSYPNWIAATHASGILIATDNTTSNYNQSYILFSYDGANFGLSNTTDDEITIDYEGVYDEDEGFSGLDVFARNSTNIFRYNLLGGSALPYFTLSTNNIRSQSLWLNPLNPSDYSIVFKNDTGIYMFNNFEQGTIIGGDEYNLSENTLIYGGGLTNSHKPKISCSSDMSQCAAMFYDSGLFTKGIYVYVSVDEDHETWTQGYYFSTINLDSVLSVLPEYHLPYDLAYNEDDGKWRLIVNTKEYEWTGTGTPTEVTPSWDCTGTCDQISARLFQFADDQGEKVIGRLNWRVAAACGAERTSRLVVLDWKEGDYDNADYTLNLCTDMGCSTECYTDAFGLYVWDGSTLEYEYGATCQVWNSGLCAFQAETYKYKSTFDMDDEYGYTYPVQYYYEDEGLAFFKRNATATPSNDGSGIYYAGHVPYHGTDWIYPSIQSYYLYDDVVNENTFTDSAQSPGTGTKYYASEIKEGFYPFYTVSGVYFYQTPFYRTVINAEYYDVSYLLYRSANISVELDCGDYQTTGTGELFELYTPCTSYNLTHNTLSYRPYTYTSDLNFLSGCDYNQVFVRLLKPYNYKIRIVDDVTLQPLSGATVSFSGDVKLTDSNGYANFTVYPLINTSLTQSTQPSLCLYYLTASATAVKSYPTTVSKTGYNPINVILYPAEIDGSITYFTERQINLFPEGTTLTVRLIDRNGNEIINPDLSSVTTATGAQNTYVIDQVSGDSLLQSSANGMPVQFYFGDNRTTFNVTVNFTYTGTTDSVILEMEKDVPQLHYFRLNQTRTEMTCVTNLDCPSNFCDNNLYYKLQGCIDGTCSFSTPEICSIGCDETYGCYNKKTITQCDTRYDCTSSCLTNWKSATAVCGTDGYCIELNRVCELECPNETGRGCSSTTGLCCEDEICFEDERERERYLLAYYFNSVEDLIPESTYVNVVDYDYICSVENRGERICIPGATIPSQIVGTYRTSETLVTSLPEDWLFTVDNEGNYDFFDLSLECGSLCDVEIDYCPYGCDSETNYCISAPLEDVNTSEKYDINIYKPIAIIEGSINETQLKESGLGFLLLLATPIFLVTGIAMLIGGVIVAKTKEPIYATVAFLVALTVFSLLGLFPIWLVLLLIVIAGLIFSKTLVSWFQGGG